MKPGLYVATVEGVPGVRVIHAPSAESEAGTSLAWRRVEPAENSTAWLLADDITDARPLVVLDPESDEDAQRLIDALAPSDHLVCTPCLQGALRALAAPTPAEPMGLGAVVVDKRGTKWIRHDSTPLHTAWINTDDCHERYAAWSDLEVAEIKSEGWSE